MDEHKRILKAYELRRQRKQSRMKFFVFRNCAHLYRIQQRHRETLRILKSNGFDSLGNLRILDIGCGNGNFLRQLLEWGGNPKNLFGIELLDEQVQKARELNPLIDIRSGSAIKLPWSDSKFDIACLHTVFSSILDLRMKRDIVNEVERVLRPGGAIIWYDFIYNNPKNHDVKGIKKKEIFQLFKGFNIYLKKISLAPPIARRIPDACLSLIYSLLFSIPFLRTHYLGLFKKKADYENIIP